MTTEQVPYEYQVCVMKQEQRSRTVTVCETTTEQRERQVNYVECIPQQKTEEYQVTTYSCVPEQHTQSYTVLVPHTTQKEIEVQVCKMVAETVEVPCAPACPCY
jgi:hypothetical protein